MELKGIKMACLGDSITEGVGVTDLSNMYYNRLQRECGIRNFTCRMACIQMMRDMRELRRD